MDTFYSTIIYPILYILPAYVANSTPVIFGGGKALDFGKKLAGKRIFGEHKTIKGLAAGIFLGSLIGFVESFYLPYMLFVGIALSVGTHFGDLIGSFIKRRLSKKPGESAWFIDQYPFLIFALLFAFPLGNYPSVLGIVFLFVITGSIHRFANYVAYKMKIKEVPW